MDQKEFAQRAARLEKIAKVLEQLPSEIRADAFALLKEFVIDQDPSKPAADGGSRQKEKSGGAETATQEAFFSKFNHDKAADNVRLIAAWHYGEYGTSPFTAEDVQKIADEVGVTVPNRIDMTLTSAKEKGKLLFTKAGRGQFKPTVHGEAALKAKYQIKKGTKSKPQAPDEAR